MPSHALQHPEVIKRIAGAPQWPSYTGVSQLVGTTADGRCTVYVDPSFGPPGNPGAVNAQDLLADADRVMKFNDATFGVVGGHVDVIVFALGGMTDGTGGADHMGCDFTTGAQIEVCASFGNSLRCAGLFEAELSECSMNGQLCGLSTGEALSRWCAMVVSNNALSDFASGPTWFADGMPNFVDSVDSTDTNYDSIGCGMAFLSWIMAGFNGKFRLSEVAQAMVAAGDTGTLSQLYGAPAFAWADFQAAIAAFPGSVTSDDPFNALVPVPGPTPPPPPPPTPSPGTSTTQLSFLILARCMSAIARGDDEPTLKAKLQSILDAN